MNLEYIVKKDDNYTNINQILKNEFNISSRLFSKLVNLKKISINGVITDTRNSVKPKDKITISFDYEEDNSNIVPTKNILSRLGKLIFESILSMQMIFCLIKLVITLLFYINIQTVVTLGNNSASLSY